MSTIWRGARRRYFITISAAGPTGWKFVSQSAFPAVRVSAAAVRTQQPFCVLCGTALVEGRGERLTKLADAPEMFYVVCKPNLSFSTPELYHKLDETHVTRHPDAQQMQAALLSGDLETIGKALGNVFEEAVVLENPEINYVKSIMMTYGAYGAQMTGSGSAVFGIFDSFEYAAVACTMLKENYPEVFIARNV